MLADGWRACLALPEAVKHDLWRALELLALDPAGARSGPALESFAQRHAGVASPATVVTALQASALLVRMAAAANLDGEALRQDLISLSPGSDPAVDTVVDGYGQLKDAVRMAMQAAVLTDHGKVLAGVDWRVDKIVGSSQGIDIASDVILLTLRWVDGAERGRTTLQVTPQAAQELKAFCDRLAAGR